MPIYLKMITAACMFVALLAVPTHEEEFPNSTLTSPCPDVFTYESYGSEPGRWYGVVNISTDATLYSLWLNIVLDRKTDILGNWVGDVTTEDNKDFKVENTEMQINPGPAVAVRFFVQYNPLNPIPKLQAIRLNGREICNANTSQQNIDDEPDLPIRPQDYDYQRPVYNSPPYRDPNWNSIGRGRIVKLYKKVTTPRSNIYKTQCGSPKEANRWPWQVALYRTQGVINKYICGGTLVSHRHVITAAQCVTRRSSSKPINNFILTVHIGKQNLMNFFGGVQIKLVENIIIHEHYSNFPLTNNLAILELQEPVTYSDWVRPACLWPEIEIDLKYVIGKNGSLLDWGLDEKGAVLLELSPAELSVVTQESCISSHQELFEPLVSDFTYCAANVEGSSFCPGSIGGGMVFKMGSTWHLRGLVSMISREPNKSRCHPTHYFLFTDLAKYLPWIQMYLYDY